MPPCKACADKRRPHLIRQRLLLADLRVRNGEIPQAESLLKEATVVYKEMRKPDPAPATTVWTQLALLHEQRGDAAKAVEFCPKAITEAAASGILDRPEGVTLGYTLAKLCLNLNDAAKGVEYSRKTPCNGTSAPCAFSTAIPRMIPAK